MRILWALILIMTLSNHAWANYNVGNVAITGVGTTANPLISGDVGIGTVNPSGYLDVEGTLSPVIFFGNTSGNVGIGTTVPLVPFQVNGVINQYSANGVSNLIELNQAGTPGWGIATTATTDNYFLYDGTTSGDPFTVLASNGNVGIGSINPAQLLDVNGTARMVQLDIQGTLTIVHDTTGGGCTAITTHAGTLTGSVTTCPH